MAYIVYTSYTAENYCSCWDLNGWFKDKTEVSLLIRASYFKCITFSASSLEGFSNSCGEQSFPRRFSSSVFPKRFTESLFSRTRPLPHVFGVYAALRTSFRSYPCLFIYFFISALELHMVTSGFPARVRHGCFSHSGTAW